MNRLFILLDQYTDNIQSFVGAHIVLAPLLILIAEEMGLPTLVPGDAILGYVGYSLSKTHTATLWEAFILAMFAVILGSSILFFVARKWGQIVLEKLSRFIFLKEKHLKKAELLFEKYGVWAIIFGRHIPGMRAPITIFSATSGIRYRTFLICTTISTSVWVLFYLSIGNRYGRDIQKSIHTYAALTIGLIIISVLLVIGLHIVGRHKANIENKVVK